MRQGERAIGAWVAVAVALTAAWLPAQDAAKQPARLTVAEQKELKRLWNDFTKARDPAAREQAFAAMLASHSLSASMVRPLIEQDLSKAMKGYTKALEVAVGPAYVEQLERLSQDQIDQIQLMRRMWMPYVLKGGDRIEFEEKFIAPCVAAADAILVKPEAITNEAVTMPRARLLEYAGYLDRCDAAAGTGPIDPTKGKVSKTGLPYPSLDQPPTFRDTLSFLDRTIVLSATIAPPGARPILERCAEVAREIDVQEAEFAMFSNTVRMLVGQIAWAVDPVMCCCVRDHTTDLRDGKADGHMSNVPGKRGFTHRAANWGCPAGSEGIGGGADGVGAIMGLSYGGGHTGPLYSLGCNLVGVGRREGLFTAIYAHDNAIKHATQATEGLLFLPPGFQKSDVRGAKAVIVAGLLARGAIGEAAAQFATKDAKAGAKKKDPYEEMLLRFFSGWVKAEHRYFIDGLAEVEKTGDFFDLKRRIIAGSQRFGSMGGFAKEIAPFVEKLKAPEATRVIEAGQAYHALVAAPSGEDRTQRFAQFAKQAEGTVYAEAAKAVADSNGEKGPWDAMIEKNPAARNFGWPSETW
jgi:hypothetical protein